MSTTPKDGGPAFPLHNPHYTSTEQGMSLRDWFAGMALQGLSVNRYYDSHGKNMADAAYRFADAMLIARTRPIDLKQPE